MILRPDDDVRRLLVHLISIVMVPSSKVELKACPEGNLDEFNTVNLTSSSTRVAVRPLLRRLQFQVPPT